MQNIIKALEAIGQSSSLKQFTSFGDMKQETDMNDDTLARIRNAEVDFVCHLEPDDDEK